MRAPLSWIAEYASLPKGSTAESVMEALVKVGLEEEGVHSFDLSVPTKLTGMVMIGMMEARKVRRNTKMTSATKTTASSMVLKTLLMDLSMNTELSLATLIRTSRGKSC